MAAPPIHPSRRSTRFSTRSRQLGQLLLESGDIQPAQLAQALQTQEERGGLLGRILREQGACAPQAVEAALHKQVQVTDIPCDELTIPPDLLFLIPRERCEAEKLCPFERVGSLLCIVMGNPLNRHAINAIENATQLRVKPFKAPWPQIKALLERSLGPAGAAPPVPPAAPVHAALEALKSLSPTSAEPPNAGDTRFEPAVSADLPRSPAPAPAAPPRSPAPATAAPPAVAGLANLDEARAEVVETDARRVQAPQAASGPPPPTRPRKSIRINVDLDHFDPGAAGEVVAGAAGEVVAAKEEAGEEPLEEIGAAPPKARAASPAPAELPPPERWAEFAPVPIADFYKEGAAPPKGETPSAELNRLLVTLPVANTVAESMGDYKRTQLQETHRLKKLRELPLEFARAPTAPVDALTLSEMEFLALAAGLEPDPAGEWDWRTAAPGPVEVAEYSPAGA